MNLIPYPTVVYLGAKVLSVPESMVLIVKWVRRNKIQSNFNQLQSILSRKYFWNVVFKIILIRLNYDK